MSKKLTRTQAFEHILFGAIKNDVPKGKWGSYVYRWRKGTLKDSTITALLQKYGFEMVLEEMWEQN
jgi:hypothetical protein